MEIKLKLPQSYDDVSMEQYVKLVKLVDKFDLSDSNQLLKYKIEQIHILNQEVSTEQLMKLRLSQLKEYFQAVEFLNSEPVTHNSKVVIIGDKEYQFQDLKLMSLEQWIDTEKYSTSIDTAHKLIAIFFIQADKYSDSELDIVSDYILKSAVTKYFWAASFFLFIHLALGEAINRFSEITQEQEKRVNQIIKRSKQIQEKIKEFRAKLPGFKSSKT